MEVISYKPLLVVLVSMAAIVPIVASGSRPNLREFWTFAAAGLKLVLVISMVPVVVSGKVLLCPIYEVIPGLELNFRVDALGLLFALVGSSLWIVTSIYSIGYMRALREHAQTRYFCFFALALSSTLGVAFAGNLFTLYVFYEMLSLATYPLVTHHQDKEARGGGRKYLMYILGTSIAFVLPAMLITYSLGGSLEFSRGGVFPSHVSAGLLTVLLILFIFGFAKAGIMPFHSWLPGAMVAPTPVSALLHAVAVVKVGIFCILRVLTGIFGVSLINTQNLTPLICYIAGFTVIVSSLIALTQDNLKRRLAFSTIGQLSYIVMGAGLASASGVVGSTLHIAMHAFGKITLFFCAGAIFVATGKKYISEMVGIGKRMPITMLAFFIGSLSVIGLPPTGGFFSKWYMLKGTLEAHMVSILVIYLVSSLLNAAYFFPIVYRAFFCTPEESLFENKFDEAPLWCVVPLALTAAASIILFFYPQPFFNLAKLIY